MYIPEELHSVNQNVNERLMQAAQSKNVKEVLAALIEGADPHLKLHGAYSSLFLYLHSHSEHKQDEISQNILRILFYCSQTPYLGLNTSSHFFSNSYFPEDMYYRIQKVKKYIIDALYKPTTIDCINFTSIHLPAGIHSVADFKVRLLHAYFKSAPGRYSKVTEAYDLFRTILRENPTTWDPHKLAVENLQEAKDALLNCAYVSLPLDAQETEIVSHWMNTFPKNSKFYELLQFIYGNEGLFLQAVVQSYARNLNEQALSQRLYKELGLNDENDIPALLWENEHTCFKAVQENITASIADSPVSSNIALLKEPYDICVDEEKDIYFTML